MFLISCSMLLPHASYRAPPCQPPRQAPLKGGKLIFLPLLDGSSEVTMSRWHVHIITAMVYMVRAVVPATWRPDHDSWSNSSSRSSAEVRTDDLLRMHFAVAPPSPRRLHDIVVVVDLVVIRKSGIYESDKYLLYDPDKMTDVNKYGFASNPNMFGYYGNTRNHILPVASTSEEFRFMRMGEDNSRSVGGSVAGGSCATRVYVAEYDGENKEDHSIVYVLLNVWNPKYITLPWIVARLLLFVHDTVIALLLEGQSFVGVTARG